jgi:hypothetical protein
MRDARMTKIMMARDEIRTSDRAKSPDRRVRGGVLAPEVLPEMSDDVLPPEMFLALQIELDRLHRSSERCRRGLRRMRGGELTKEAYCELLEEELTVHREWEAKNRALFASRE